MSAFAKRAAKKQAAQLPKKRSKRERVLEHLVKLEDNAYFCVLSIQKPCLYVSGHVKLHFLAGNALVNDAAVSCGACPQSRLPTVALNASHCHTLDVYIPRSSHPCRIELAACAEHAEHTSSTPSPPKDVLPPHLLSLAKQALLTTAASTPMTSPSTSSSSSSSSSHHEFVVLVVERQCPRIHSQLAFDVILSRAAEKKADTESVTQFAPPTHEGTSIVRPHAWFDALAACREQCSEHKNTCFMVAGGTNVGKSTFFQFLGNR